MSYSEETGLTPENVAILEHIRFGEEVRLVAEHFDCSLDAAEKVLLHIIIPLYQLCQDSPDNQPPES